MKSVNGKIWRNSASLILLNSCGICIVPKLGCVPRRGCGTCGRERRLASSPPVVRLHTERLQCVSSCKHSVNTHIPTRPYKKVSSNPEELLNLCKEHKCYPDIWSLHFWSNWLSPVALPKRFDTAFFVAALDNEIPQISNNSEVTYVKWSSPQEILEKNLRKELELYPPQAYELNRLIHFSDIDVLVKYAAERSSSGCELIYPVVVEAKDGKIHVLPGDDLYPLNVNYKEGANILHPEKTILELRENCHMLHRLEITSLKEFKTEFVFRNHHPPDHINMGDKIISVNSTLHKNVK